MIIHPDFKLESPSVTPSKTSFGTALKNLANKQTFILEPTQPHIESSTSVSSTYAKSGKSLDWTLGSSMNPDVEMPDVHSDSNLISSQQTLDIPSSSTSQPTLNQALSIEHVTTNVSSPPTLLLDSVILKEVCENIFEDLIMLVKARNNLIHIENYEEKWTALRERVDTVMCELQKLSLYAHNQSVSNLNNWFNDVVKSMKEVEVNRNHEKSRLYISDTPFFLDASSIITSGVQKNLDLSWLIKLKIQTDIPILEKLKHDYEQEQRIKKLERELFE